MTRVRSRFRWAAAIAAVLVLLGSTTLLWGFATYVRMVRLRVGVTDAYSRVEATGRSRVELASSLIQSADAFACLDTARLAQLQGAVDGAAPGILLGHVLENPGPYRDLREGQGRLTTELAATWPTIRLNPRAGARVLLEDFQSRLERQGVLLADGMDGLERSIEAYRAVAASFPGSTVARIAGLGETKPQS